MSFDSSDGSMEGLETARMAKNSTGVFSRTNAMLVLDGKSNIGKIGRME
jgi:hypothetical protein